MTLKRLALVVLCCTLPACYAYVPTTGAPPTDRPVRLTLSDSGSVVLAARVGPGIEALDGRVVGDSAGAWVLAVSGTVARDGSEADWKGERLTVPSALVASVGERRFSRGRTALFGSIATAALVGITEAMLGPGGASAAGPSSGPGTAK